MIIGQIDYINTLIFKMFIKKLTDNKIYLAMDYHKGCPRYINNLFSSKKIEASFISSIVSKKSMRLGMGIVAQKEVLSVLVCSGDKSYDNESNTSNILSDILGIKGKVVIGDKALKIYLQDSCSCIDLSKAWYDKYNLPFVFAVFCANKNISLYKKLVKRFLRQNIKIPQYILEKYSKKTNISKKDILYYLSKISYQISHKENISLNKFISLSKSKR
jgi:chorismate dehydratase